MAKKQISTYKYIPGAIPPAYGQYPKAVALLTANNWPDSSQTLLPGQVINIPAAGS
jgi:hypothetical protein